MKTSSIRFAVLLVAILGVGVLVNTWAYLGEAHVDRKHLQSFPEQLGAWQKSGDQMIDEPTMKVLRATDYLLRDFRRADGETANFYVGYYATQRNGATYHSPLNCLPGTGWTMRDGALVRVTPAGGGKPFEANRYLVENGDDRQLLIYWYQGRGRAVASEYWGKIYTVLDSVERRRSDGAMVRVMVPFRGDEAQALRAAEVLSAQAAPHLSAFVPD